MSAIGGSGRSIGCNTAFSTLLAGLAMVVTGFAQADTVVPQSPSPDVEARSETAQPSDLPQPSGRPSMEELREHASTITEILELASARVDRLAAEDAGTPALVEAIRQELSLTRRWNSHLSAILLEVTDARRALGERERLAAREVARMTAVAEEARRELVALKEVLERPSADGPRHGPEKRSDRQSAQHLAGVDGSLATDPTIGAGSDEGLQAVRETLASVQNAQKSAKRDVDAVRGKIIEVLQTLATQHGYLPTGPVDHGAALSSEDIVAWAASMAARLNQDGAASDD